MTHTESTSRYDNLEDLSILQLVEGMNQEDFTVAEAVQNAIPQITTCCELVYSKMKTGGRLFYIGAGTSGRLGVVDASECPPTYGVPHGLVVGIMAGGDGAMRKAVEFAEDDTEQGFKDLKEYSICSDDVVVGISASGRTPYVMGALLMCKENGIATAAIVCNPDSEIAHAADAPIEVITGPEFVTGSTRMKAGTATKMVLNMITTSVMIKLGKVKGNKMVDMQLTNNKLILRGTKMVMDATNLDQEAAEELLLRAGNVRFAIEAWQKSLP